MNYCQAESNRSPANMQHRRNEEKYKTGCRPERNTEKERDSCPKANEIFLLMMSALRNLAPRGGGTMAQVRCYILCHNDVRMSYARLTTYVKFALHKAIQLGFLRRRVCDGKYYIASVSTGRCKRKSIACSEHQKTPLCSSMPYKRVHVEVKRFSAGRHQFTRAGTRLKALRNTGTVKKLHKSVWPTRSSSNSWRGLKPLVSFSRPYASTQITKTGRTLPKPSLSRVKRRGNTATPHSPSMSRSPMPGRGFPPVKSVPPPPAQAYYWQENLYEDYDEEDSEEEVDDGRYGSVADEPMEMYDSEDIETEKEKTKHKTKSKQDVKTSKSNEHKHKHEKHREGSPHSSHSRHEESAKNCHGHKNSGNKNAEKHPQKKQKSLCNIM